MSTRDQFYSVDLFFKIRTIVQFTDCTLNSHAWDRLLYFNDHINYLNLAIIPSRVLPVADSSFIFTF